ncbi:MAG: DNA translocase FtsK 4TM domain-containing protein, partial [Campylobacterales bacterium]|nr:DNA translocase FtsK 4TM domain-containing protein [Campylobacterales bacterium]
MRDTFFIFLFGVLIYLGFATIFGTNALMGSFGVTFASFNHLYFGYISYIYLFALIFPLFKVYKNSNFNFRNAELSVASLLVLFSVLLAQGLLVENNFRGKFGADFVDFLSPYIGTFGLWVFWLIITLVSIVI